MSQRYSDVNNMCTIKYYIFAFMVAEKKWMQISNFQIMLFFFFMKKHIQVNLAGNEEIAPLSNYEQTG